MESILKMYPLFRCVLMLINALMTILFSDPSVSAALQPNFCLPKSIGPCKGRKIRYFYNAKTRQCQRFFYGGCKGNLNNFYTMALCMNTCGHVEWSWR
uniref:BPTI/Kunitz inhibitor domain-containing protein n=1 Tax=Bos mutus grunniens TaxID=30521 RepID=A0A8B9XSI6_BOSMU